VATDGKDDNPGTEPQPFRSIARGVSALGPGDTLYVRKGTYYESVTVSASGTEEEPILIAAYPGEHPVIDAQDTLPGDYYGYLITVDGDYVILDGLEAKNVFGTAVVLTGNHGTVRNMKIHHCLSKGIFVGGLGYCSTGLPQPVGNVVEDNEFWVTSLIHEGIHEGGRWTGAINVARCPQHTIVRRNTVHETWGIGIHIFETSNVTVEDNVVWNNQMSHYYVNQAPHTTLQRNLAYSTPDSTFLYRGVPGVGIAFCDEKSDPLSHHVTIVNNLTLGTSRGFYFFNQQPGSGLKHFLIAHNTFAYPRKQMLTIRAGDHENSRIENNIFLDRGTASIASVPDHPGLAFSHNLWSKTPPAAASNSNDVIGAPGLEKSGQVGPGLLGPHWFSLLANSPAIDSGVTLSEVPDDFDRVSRPRGAGYDIGAYEHLVGGRGGLE
jgi:hypothetical protein